MAERPLGMGRYYGEIARGIAPVHTGERNRAGPPAAAVRAELHRLLSSPEFAKAKRAARFLHFLVERTLEGRGETLKEYVIALEVFDRDQTFDPRIDSLVRVEAARLRARLNACYAKADRSGLQIELQAGSYIPVFLVPGREDTAESREPRLHSRVNWLGIAALAAALLGLGLWFAVVHRAAPREFRVLNLHQLTAYPGITAYGALSPDSTWIVGSSDRGDDKHLHLWRYPVADGGEPLQLTSGPHNDVAAVVSPDGKWIAFESDSKPAGIYMIPSAGGDRVLVAPFGLGPRFSPDGRWLVYWMVDPDTTFGRVFVVSVGRPGEPVGIGREFDDAHTPSWTPGGQGLLVCGTRQSRGGLHEEHDLWFVPLEGRGAVKTGAFAALTKAGVDAHTGLLGRTSFAWIGGGVLFPGSAAGRIRLWWLPLSVSTWRVAGGPVAVAGTNDQQVQPSFESGLLAFTGAHARTSVWSVPLAANGGRASGVAERLTDDALDQLSPSISADGRRVVFLSASHSTELRAHQRDLVAGKETALGAPGQITNRIKVSWDGRTAYYRILEGPEPRLQAIYSADLLTGRSARVCRDCGAPTGVSPDGRLVIYETGSTPTRLAALRVDSGESWEFARHSHYGMRSARVAPDGRWIAFHVDRGWEGKQIFIAPFREAEPIGEEQWIPVTEPGSVDQEVWWSPNGRYLYFLSDRDGHRCVWTQEWNSYSRRPVGAAAAIYHFHEARLTPLSFVWRAPSYVGLSVAKDRLVLSLTEISSNIWIGTVER